MALYHSQTQRHAIKFIIPKNSNVQILNALKIQAKLTEPPHFNHTDPSVL